MKVAIAMDGNNVSGHFGKCENFTVIEIENSKVINKTILNTSGNQHGLLPGFLASNDINAVIAGGMGEGARQNLISNNIEIFSGVIGNIDDVINEYMNGTLKTNNTICTKHDHPHDSNECGCHCGHN